MILLIYDPKGLSFNNRHFGMNLRTNEALPRSYQTIANRKTPRTCEGFLFYKTRWLHSPVRLWSLNAMLLQTGSTARSLSRTAIREDYGANGISISFDFMEN